MASELGDYTIEKELGRGAMGVVYLARHRPTGSLRAVKVLGAATDETKLARFRREAEALARVGGEGIVPVHEVGFERGRAFFAMAHMPGGSLRDLLQTKGRLDWRQAATLGVSLARALERCHAARVIHRDLKPDNVLFDEHGSPHLADFGIARDLDAAPLTKTGAVVGTGVYMPPEQLAENKVDDRADVYALGVVLHEAVSGIRPFGGENPVALYISKTSGKKRPLPDDVPPALEAAIARALAVDPAARGSASDMAEELERALVDPVGPPRARRGARALILILGLGLGAVVVGGVAVGIAVLGGVESPHPGPPPLRGGGGGPGWEQPEPPETPADRATAARLLDEVATVVSSREALSRVGDRLKRAREASPVLPEDAVARVVSAAASRIARVCDETSVMTLAREMAAAYDEVLATRAIAASLGGTVRPPYSFGSFALVHAGRLLEIDGRGLDAVAAAELAIETDPAYARQAAEAVTFKGVRSKEVNVRVAALIERALVLSPAGHERALAYFAKANHMRSQRRWDDMLAASCAAIDEEASTTVTTLVARSILEMAVSSVKLPPSKVELIVARAPRSPDILLASSLVDDRHPERTVQAFEIGFAPGVGGHRIFALRILSDNAPLLRVVVPRLLDAGRLEDAAGLLQKSPSPALKALANETRNATTPEARAAVARKLAATGPPP